MAKLIDNALITSMSKIIGEILSGSEITRMFCVLDFPDFDNINKRPYNTTKWKRLDETISYKCSTTKKATPLFKVIQYVMKPQDFINNAEGWHVWRRTINSHLMFYGYELDDAGTIISIQSVKSFTEAQKRLQSFQDKLYMYEIHPLVLEFCKEELFHENYFHAILEASKSVFQRVRDISELELDGSKLIQQAFSTKQPVILIKGNMLSSDTDRSLYNGLKNLIETIVSMYRNPTAHSPKLYDETSETDAITAFTLMSLAHRILDNCFNVREVDKS